MQASCHLMAARRLGSHISRGQNSRQLRIYQQAASAGEFELQSGVAVLSEGVFTSATPLSSAHG